MTSELKHTCLFCKESFNDKEELQIHFRKHGDPAFNNRINNCNKAQNEPDAPLEVCGTKSEMVNCDVCSEVFPTISKAITHKHKVHPNHDAKYFCSWCGKLFTLKHLYNKHITCHDEEDKMGDEVFHCDCCNVDFNIYSAMIYHNKFFHRQDMELPALGHSKLQKFVNKELASLYFCAFCGEEYVNKINLHKHMADEHQDENQFPDEVLRCPLCEAVFYHLDAYEFHLTFHSSDDIYNGKDVEKNTLTEFTLESVPPMMEKVEDHQPEENDETTEDIDIEQLLQLAENSANPESDHTDKPKHKKHKKHKKSKKAAITLDEFLNMNTDVFGEGLDFQGIEEVPTQVVKKHLKVKSKPLKSATRVVTNSNIEKLKQQGIVIKRKNIKKDILPTKQEVFTNNVSNVQLKTTDTLNTLKTPSNDVLSKLINQSQNQIKILKSPVQTKLSQNQNLTIRAIPSSVIDSSDRTGSNSPENIEVECDVLPRDSEGSSEQDTDENLEHYNDKSEKVTCDILSNKEDDDKVNINAINNLDNVPNQDSQDNSSDLKESLKRNTQETELQQESMNSTNVLRNISQHITVKHVRQSTLPPEKNEEETQSKNNKNDLMVSSEILNKNECFKKESTSTNEMVLKSLNSQITMNSESQQASDFDGVQINVKKDSGLKILKPLNPYKQRDCISFKSADKHNPSGYDDNKRSENEDSDNIFDINDTRNIEADRKSINSISGNNESADIIKKLGHNLTVKSTNTADRKDTIKPDKTLTNNNVDQMDGEFQAPTSTSKSEETINNLKQMQSLTVKSSNKSTSNEECNNKKCDFKDSGNLTKQPENSVTHEGIMKKIGQNITIKSLNQPTKNESANDSGDDIDETMQNYGATESKINNNALNVLKKIGSNITIKSPNEFIHNMMDDVDKFENSDNQNAVKLSKSVNISKVSEYNSSNSMITKKGSTTVRQQQRFQNSSHTITKATQVLKKNQMAVKSLTQTVNVSSNFLVDCSRPNKSDTDWSDNDDDMNNDFQLNPKSASGSAVNALRNICSSVTIKSPTCLPKLHGNNVIVPFPSKFGDNDIRQNQEDSDLDLSDNEFQQRISKTSASSPLQRHESNSSGTPINALKNVCSSVTVKTPTFLPKTHDNNVVKQVQCANISNKNVPAIPKIISDHKTPQSSPPKPVSAVKSLGREITVKSLNTPRTTEIRKIIDENEIFNVDDSDSDELQNAEPSATFKQLSSPITMDYNSSAETKNKIGPDINKQQSLAKHVEGEVDDEGIQPDSSNKKSVCSNLAKLRDNKNISFKNVNHTLQMTSANQSPHHKQQSKMPPSNLLKDFHFNDSSDDDNLPLQKQSIEKAPGKEETIDDIFNQFHSDSDDFENSGFDDFENSEDIEGQESASQDIINKLKNLNKNLSIKSNISQNNALASTSKILPGSDCVMQKTNSLNKFQSRVMKRDAESSVEKTSNKSNLNPCKKTKVTSDNVNQVSDQSKTLKKSTNQTNAINNQVASVNQEVTTSVKTIQTKTVVEEITTTVTRTIKTINQEVSVASGKNMVTNVETKSTGFVRPQKVVQGIRPQGRNYQGVAVKQCAPTIRQRFRAPTPNATISRPVLNTANVLPNRSVATRQPRPNQIRPANQRISNSMNMNTNQNSPRSPFISKPLKIAPNAMNQPIKVRNQEDSLDGPFSCFKKPKEAISNSNAAINVASSSQVSSSNFSSSTRTLKTNSVTSQVNSEFRSCSQQQVSKVNTASGIKVAKSSISREEVREVQKCEVNTANRTTMDTIERLQKQGLLIKKPRLDEPESENYDADDNDEYDDSNLALESGR